MTWSVGFDLDMTLVDTRRGIVAALTALADETGAEIDAQAYTERLGPPIQGELSRFFSGEEFDSALARFRHHMAEFGVQQSHALPGAADAFDLVQRLGGKVMVVTAKHQPLAEATVASCGLHPDIVAGDLWAEQKATALLKHAAVGFIGDHPGDVIAAQTAGVWSIAIATGGYDREQLLGCGATVAFDTLPEALVWLEQRLSERRAG